MLSAASAASLVVGFLQRSEALALVKKEREGGAMKLDPEDRHRINKLASAFGEYLHDT